MSLHKPPSKLKEKPLSREVHNFDYAALDSKTLFVVQQCTSEIKERLRDAAKAIWEIGQKLVDVRNCLSYGQFNSWLKTEFQWSRSTAYNYINVFETFASCPNFGQLDIAASALYLLAASSIPEEARKEVLESARVGETITYSKAKAIISRYQKSSQTKKDQQSSTINVCAEPLERKSFTNATPQPLSINTDDICILLQANVKYLTDEQIKVVWQAIAHRIRSESLALYNLSDSELKQLHKEVEQELNQRQYH